jgi:hypothetical protein
MYLSLGEDALNERMNAWMMNECMSLLADQHHNGFVNGLLQHKLNLTLQEYRGMHKQSSRGQLPHNKLIYPESLRYLSLWVLGNAISFVSFCRPATIPQHWELRCADRHA